VVWAAVPDFRETYEIASGFLKDPLPAYDRKVIRELLVNAIVHRPYTQGGDIFLNLHPDRLTIVNPGPFPIGVTPRNVLHTTVRRNDRLARIFHDLKLMEGEGSGYDMIYEILLSQGRPLPEPQQGPDRVEVTIRRRVLAPEVIAFIEKADKTFQLTQREKICVGLLAQHDGLKAGKLAELLELYDADSVGPWLGRLVDFGLVAATGKTKGKTYFVAPEVLKSLEFPAVTSLARIQPHRLEALVYEDVKRYPRSPIGDIHGRIGSEIPRHQVKAALDTLSSKGRLVFEGERRWRRYSVAPGSIE
jgi:ATP-dependent DNA helicase RecG